VIINCVNLALSYGVFLVSSGAEFRLISGGLNGKSGSIARKFNLQIRKHNR
jgi:hypothetical protein